MPMQVGAGSIGVGLGVGPMRFDADLGAPATGFLRTAPDTGFILLASGGRIELAA